MSETYDLAVIGGGPGGYSAALRARQLGLTVALLEKERVGGVCLNRGCIPTKALLSDLEGIRWMRRAAKEGIIDHVPPIAFSSLMTRKTAVVDALVGNLEKLLASTGVALIFGRARIREPGHIELDGKAAIKARNIVIATGSRSWAPPIPGKELPGVVTTRHILNLEKLPEKLIIIGGGIIGQEFAAIFSGLGTRVTVFEALPRILFEVDSDMAKRYSSLLPGRGVITETAAKVLCIEKVGHLLRVVYEKREKEKTADADLVLMATGRVPNFHQTELDELGIAVEHRAVRVDGFLRTAVEGIYAIGDVTGRKMLAHVAAHHGEIAAENIAGRQRSVDDEMAPACVFTSPQIAWVGLTQEQAKASNRAFRTSTFALAASGKAQAMGEARGWLKLIEDTETRAIIGAHFMGPHVSELITEMTLAIRSGMTASDIADTIHPHPTLSEAVREAALGLLDGPIHAAPRVKSFDGK